MQGNCTSPGVKHLPGEEIYLDHNLKRRSGNEIMFINMTGIMVIKVEPKSFSKGFRICISGLPAGAYQVLFISNKRITHTRFTKFPGSEY